MMQTVDFRFELIFLLLVLLSGVCLIAAAVVALRRRRGAARRLLKFLGMGWALYLSIVFLVAAGQPQRIIAPREDLCFDEMCFALENVQTASQIGPVRAKDTFYIVTVRAGSHARGRAQSEKGLYAQLWSASRLYSISPEGQRAWDAAHPGNAALTTRLRPGQSVLSDQVFDVRAPVADAGLVLSNGFTPGYFVIGECPLFHKPTMLQLTR